MLQQTIKQYRYVEKIRLQ